MSSPLTDEQMTVIKEVLQRDPPKSISDDDFTEAYEKLNEFDPALASAWILTFDEESNEHVVREKLPVEKTARRARWTARVSKATKSATTTALGEEDAPVVELPDQRRIMLIAAAVLIAVATLIITFTMMSSRSPAPAPVVDPVIEEPTVVAEPELPVIPTAPVVTPPPVAVEPPPAPAAPSTFTNQTPAPAPAPAASPAPAAEPEASVLPVHTFVEDGYANGVALETVLYTEAPVEGASSGLNQVFVHVNDMGTGGPLNVSDGFGGTGVASGLATQPGGPASNSSLMLYEEAPATAGGNSAVIYSEPAAPGVAAGGSPVMFRQDAVIASDSLFVHGEGSSGVPAAELPMAPGSLITQEYPLEQLAAGVSFDSPADALRAAGVPEEANNASSAATVLMPPGGTPPLGSPSADGNVSDSPSSVTGAGFDAPSREWDPLPTTQADFDAFLADEWLTDSAAEAPAVVPGALPQLVTGERIPARLVTSATILDGVPAPVIAETFGSWCAVGACPTLTFIGTAELLGGNRVVINFHTLVTEEGSAAFQGIALSADYGTSIPADIRDETPTLAPDLMRASLGGLTAYANSMLNQTRTTFTPDGQAIQESVLPSLEALIAGNAASALALPQSSSTVVRLAEIDPGVDVIVAVGLAY